MRSTKSFLRGLLFLLALYPSVSFSQAPVSDDTFSSADRKANYGDKDYVAVQSPSSTAYIRFDLSRLPQGITGDQINKATVRLWVSAVTHSGSFDVVRVASSWDEDTLRGDNLPLLGRTDAHNVEVSKESKNHYLVVDITGLVRDWVNNAQTNYGIALVPVGNISAAFDSKENGSNSHDAELNVQLEKVGPRGPQGVPGLVGTAGPTGATGPMGPAGPAGPQGVPGPVGPAGATGAIGPAGPSGPVGATGPAGPTGPQGVPGPVGAAGATGAVGPTGLPGPIGATGPQGVPGPVGAAGATGGVGPAGPPGPVGATGPQGVPGTVGAAGATGGVGPAGPPGPVGAMGTQGPVGPQGIPGPAGPQGASGPQGPTGATGAIGPVGPQGPAGPTNYPGKGQLTVSNTLAPSSVINLSAEGTRDWFAPGNAGANFHSKLLGGQIMKSFDWVTAGGNVFTQSSSYSINSVASDDATGLALTSVKTDQGVSMSVGTGLGFRLRAPASSGEVRTLRLYCSVFSGAVTLTAHLADGSAPDVTDVVDVGANGFNFFVWTVTYQSAHDGQEVEVAGILTTNRGSVPNIKFIAATLQ